MNIALVNDMALALEAMRRSIARGAEHRILWTARNGAEAVSECAKARPDLILMDLIMPVMDGVEATRRIMAATPCPILIVTASVGKNAWRVFEAMGHGALDAVDTPTLGTEASAAALLEKIALLGRMNAGRVPNAWVSATPFSAAAKELRDPLVAIGASAGGPMAVAKLLQMLPRDFAAAVVVVQHVDVQFAPGMASWLSLTSPLPVRVAHEGEALQKGVVLLAATNDHLVLKSSRCVGYTAEPREAVYRPSVDVFFQSVAKWWTGGVGGVLLTGMGRDGALGLKTLRNHGHLTIAQDQATSAVYGMPKAAAQLGAATEILPLNEIGPRLARWLARAA